MHRHLKENTDFSVKNTLTITWCVKNNLCRAWNEKLPELSTNILTVY